METVLLKVTLHGTQTTGHELEMAVIIQQQIIGSPNIIMRFLTLTVKSLIFYRTHKEDRFLYFCSSQVPFQVSKKAVLLTTQIYMG